MTQTNVVDEIKSLTRWAEADPRKYVYEDGWADGLVKQRKLSAGQLRKIFGRVKRIELDLPKDKDEGALSHTMTHIQRRQNGDLPKDKDDVALSPDVLNRLIQLLPQAAYDVGRNQLPREFYDLLKDTFQKNKIKSRKDFERFVEFLTAMVAYHKFHEKKDGQKGGERS